MNFVYSLTLLVALTTGALCLLAGLAALARTRRPLPGEPERSLTLSLYRVARTGALVSITFAIVSMGVHLAFGHRPGTAEGLGPLAFFTVHPAYLGTVAMASTVGLFAHLGRSRLDGP